MPDYPSFEMLIEPYVYVRTITLGLGTIWTLHGALRTWRFARRWQRRLELIDFERSWLRRRVAIFVLRTTVLDPINLALLLTLFGLWSIRAIV